MSAPGPSPEQTLARRQDEEAAVRVRRGRSEDQPRARADRTRPLVRVEGHIIHLGRGMGTAEGCLVGDDGKLYARATTTCFIFEAPTAKDTR